MMIGFTKRVSTVPESDALEGEDLVPIDIDVAILRLAEREHLILFRLQSGGTAIVDPDNDRVNAFFDATFGTRDTPENPLETYQRLAPFENNLASLAACIRNDLRPEDEECFTIRIFPVSVPGRQELFSCNEDNSGSTNFFCEITICIEDDDGMYV